MHLHCCCAYDAVGNRTQKTSTLPGMPGGASNCNANDQLSTDTYDADGSTTASNGNGYACDFENHLVQQAGITIVYDGDGSYTYNALGRRTTMTDASRTTTYNYDMGTWMASFLPLSAPHSCVHRKWCPSL